MTSTVLAALDDAEQTLRRFISNKHNIENIQNGIDLLSRTFENDGKVISCGNGGSMCDSMHFAEELTGRFRKDRRALPAMAVSDPSHISCVANDFGYDHIFSRQVEGWGKKGDVLVAISTSGNSPNVVKAVEVAKSAEMHTIGLLGKGGGKLKDLVDVPLVVDNNISDRIQEIHIKIIHIFIEGVERKLFPENYS